VSLCLAFPHGIAWQSLIAPGGRAYELSLVVTQKPEVWRNLRDEFPHHTDVGCRRWIAPHVSAREAGKLCLEVDGPRWRFHWPVAVERCLSLSPRSVSGSARNTGAAVMTEGALGRSRRHEFAQLGIVRIYAHVFEGTGLGCGCLEKNGYIGKASQEERFRRGGSSTRCSTGHHLTISVADRPRCAQLPRGGMFAWTSTDRLV